MLLSLVTSKVLHQLVLTAMSRSVLAINRVPKSVLDTLDKEFCCVCGVRMMDFRVYASGFMEPNL